MQHPKRSLRHSWRFGRLVLYLMMKPRDVVPYLRYGGFTAKTPLELGMPWWSFGAVRALEQRLEKTWNAFEYGSGGSSIYLSQQVNQIRCIENESEWVAAVRKNATGRGLHNIEVIHQPFDFWDTSTFPQSAYLLALRDPIYDLIVIDGQEWTDPVRDTCFWHAENYIRPGGLIVLDDSWRYPQVKAKNRAKKWTDFRGAGFCRAGVTSTCIFEY